MIAQRGAFEAMLECPLNDNERSCDLSELANAWSKFEKPAQYPIVKHSNSFILTVQTFVLNLIKG